MVEKIKLWWKFEGRYYHKNFIQGVKNVWKWLPVVWKDRDYDSFYIYKVLQFKLEQQAYGIGSRDRHTTAQRDAEMMLLCARLCYIQREDSYENEYLDYIKSDHKFIPIENGEFFEVETTVMEDNLDEYFALYPRQYKLATAGEVGSHKHKYRTELAMEIAYRNQERSRKLLFKILEQRLNEWWD